jgi:uncharacterized damage-inducible protein DinB
MLKETLIKLISRDLNGIIDEINQYKDESCLWKTEGLVTNSAGNISLHVISNLNHFIGAILGESGYVRNRELEFSLKNIPKAELIKDLKATIVIVEKTLTNLSTEDLQADYKLQVFNAPMTTEYFLVHLSSHLAYHLGQINYHRRLLD